jgi:hypothetical protein
MNGVHKAVTRRDFLYRAAAVGGSALLSNTMNAWGMCINYNLFNKYPDMVNGKLLAEQRANLDNSAVGIYPSFSPFGINGAYYYAKAGLKF